MARVLVAHIDDAVCDALAVALADAAGHLVVSTSDGELSLAALWLSESPMVALIGDRLMPFTGIDIVRVAANDKAEGELGRHRYIVMSTEPGCATVQAQGARRRLDVPVLALPVELDRLIEMVDQVAAKKTSAK